MDKEQTIHAFFSSFGWKAYDETLLPDDAEMPRITYGLATDSLGHPVSMAFSLWDKSYSWKTVTEKAQEIADAITFMHPPAIKCDSGRIYITPGSPWTQRMSEPTDDTIRRLYLNLEVEYFTEN